MIPTRTYPHVIPRVVSTPFPSSQRAPEHGPRPQSTGVPYRRSPFGRASLSLLTSPTMLVAAAASPRAPDVHRPFYHWYDHLFIHLTTVESLYSAPLAFICVWAIKMRPFVGLQSICVFSSNSPSCACALAPPRVVHFSSRPRVACAHCPNSSITPQTRS